jgi:hypothetical protein
MMRLLSKLVPGLPPREEKEIRLSVSYDVLEFAETDESFSANVIKENYTQFVVLSP